MLYSRLLMTQAKEIAADTQSLTFELALEELQKTVERLEKGQVPLDDAVRLFERGMQMKRHCEERLAEAKKRIDLLVVSNDGGLTAKAFDESADVPPTAAIQS
jgi:exodeoxyribonuclease VII small subunit